MGHSLSFVGKVETALPRERSHTLIWPSMELEAAWELLWSTATEMTPRWWPSSLCRGSRDVPSLRVAVNDNHHDGLPCIPTSATSAQCRRPSL